MHRKLFIACPISKFFVNRSTLDADFRRFIQGVRAHCLRYSSDVFLALDRERYGEALLPPELCTPLDYKGLAEADEIIAFPEDSMGVAVELGWASALGKRILVFADQRFPCSPLIRAIDTICSARVVEYEHRGYLQALDFVVREVDRFLSNDAADTSVPELVSPGLPRLAQRPE